MTNEELSCASVLMMKTTDMSNSHDLSLCWRLNCPWYRALFIERQVCSRLVIVGIVGFQSPPQMPLIYNDNVIQALSPYGTDNSLNIRTLPGRAWGRKHLLNAEAFHPISESVTINAIPVTQ